MRYCPICGDTRSQQYLGKWGPDAVMRCGICGIEYYRDLDDDPIISKSEWGSYRYDGEADMKVLRKRAEGAVRYFNKGGKPRVDMQTNVFGYPFSIIDNGKLVDTENAYKGNVIIRALSYGGGIYEGKVTLSYNDDYNDGRGQGGSGCVLIGDVKDVRIENGFLIISGGDLGKPISYAYRIQERPDDKRFVFPIPKGGKVPEEKPVPKRQPTIDDYGPTEPPKPKPKPVPKPDPKPSVADMIYGSMHDFCVLLEMLETGMEKAGQWYYQPYDGRKIPHMTAADMERMFGDPDEGAELLSIFRHCYLSVYSEHWSGWERFGITYGEYKLVEKRLREMAKGYPVKKTQAPPKPAPKTAPKPVPKPQPKKPEPKKQAPKPAPAAERKKGSLIYEVRVDGAVRGSFSSQAKAEAMKRELKRTGLKAKVYGVRC